MSSNNQLKRPLINRGTFVSIVYVFVNVVFWALGTTPKIIAGVATGYSLGALTSVADGSYGGYLLLSIILALIMIPLVFAALAVWCVSILAAVVIFIRRILGRVPSFIESLFWATVEWMATVLILGVAMFNYTTRFGADPSKVRDLDLGTPAHLFSLVLLLIIAKIGRSEVIGRTKKNAEQDAASNPLTAE